MSDFSIPRMIRLDEFNDDWLDVRNKSTQFPDESDAATFELR